MSDTVLLVGGPCDRQLTFVKRWPLSVARPLVGFNDGDAVSFEIGVYDLVPTGDIAIWRGWRVTGEIPSRARGWIMAPRRARNNFV